MEGFTKVLVACEFSGIVREAFRAKGHEAFSCDFIESEIPSEYHIQGDVINQLWMNWDLMIAFPPCTYLAVSGARWFKDRLIEQEEALHFVDFLLNSPIQRICLENPIGIISTHIRKPDQIIQPWMFGHNETKAICLWLKNLPKLTPTKIMSERLAFVHHAAPSPYRWKTRSRTFQGIADAMASQWGSIRP